MSKSPLLSGGSALAAAFALGFGALPAQAQQPTGPQAAPKATSNEIIVTGSYIRGTPEDAALPVDVLTAADLQKVGTPTITELVKSLGVSSGRTARATNSRRMGSKGSATSICAVSGLREPWCC